LGRADIGCTVRAADSSWVCENSGGSDVLGVRAYDGKSCRDQIAAIIAEAVQTRAQVSGKTMGLLALSWPFYRCKKNDRKAGHLMGSMFEL
jgi:hypothetical protein